MTKIAPIHPGEVLLEEFLEPLGVAQHRLAVSIGVPPRRINEIVHGKRRVTADTALRLSRYFGTTDRFRLNLQIRVDLDQLPQHGAHGLTDQVHAVTGAERVQQLGQGRLGQGHRRNLSSVSTWRYTPRITPMAPSRPEPLRYLETPPLAGTLTRL